MIKYLFHNYFLMGPYGNRPLTIVDSQNGSQCLKYKCNSFKTYNTTTADILSIPTHLHLKDETEDAFQISHKFTFILE